MQLSAAPSQLVLPWGNGDSSKTNPIPVPSQIGITPGAASWTDGFPPLCATPVTSGGLPPTKADMNGGLYQMSAVDVWLCAGGLFRYNSAFQTAIGGYPAGALVITSTGLGLWRCLVDNNMTNPDTGGAGWVPVRCNGNTPLSSVYTTANQSVTSTAQVNFNSVEQDAYSMWNSGSNEFVAPWAGWYRISGIIDVTCSSGSAGYIQAQVYHNGSLAKRGQGIVMSSSGSGGTVTEAGLSFNAMISLAIGDTLELYLLYGGGGDALVAGGDGKSSWMQLEYLGG